MELKMRAKVLNNHIIYFYCQKISSLSHNSDSAKMTGKHTCLADLKIWLSVENKRGTRCYSAQRPCKNFSDTPYLSEDKVERVCEREYFSFLYRLSPKKIFICKLHCFFLHFRVSHWLQAQTFLSSGCWPNQSLSCVSLTLSLLCNLLLLPKTVYST